MGTSAKARNDVGARLLAARNAEAVIPSTARAISDQIGPWCSIRSDEIALDFNDLEQLYPVGGSPKAIPLDRMLL
ncbi:MAG: hypothetical protein ACREQB_04615 [Candidatus Binataceae bacterium]